MDGLALSTTTTTTTSTTSTTIAHSSLFGNGFLFPSIQRKSTTGKRRALWFPKRTQFVVLAAKDEPRFDQWDQMELKFGRMIGEDPKLTLAKIMARKVNPDVSFHEVEKSFYKNKGEMAEIEVLPFDVGRGKKEVKESNSVDGLNLVRPVLKNGITFEDEGNKPMMVKKPIKHVGEGFDNNVTKRSVPNVILRKPSMFAEDDVDDKGSKSKVRIKPNLTLNMRSDQTNDRGTFSDMTLLRKPEPMSVGNAEAKANNDSVGIIMEREEGNTEYGGFALLQKPEVKTCIDESSASEGEPIGTEQELERDSVLGMQPLERTDIESNPNEETVENDQDDTNLADFTANISAESPLLGKPKRLDQSVRVASPSVTEEAVPVNHDDYGNASSEVKDLPSTSPSEDAHWSRAEKLIKTGDRVEVELISSSIGGFAVSFGSLVGFLPYRNLSTKWKFLAFESWLRQKGLDPSMYRKQLGIIGTYEATENNTSLDSNTIPKIDGKNGGEITPDMKLEDLLRIYDQEKLKFLSSFIGQRIKVNILMANRNLRKLIVSLRPKEKEEMVEKKRSLMARLQIGDVVKCCIKKITYFGIFVEVEGVPALIHQSEVSWDATLDPGSYFKVGQILEAKVHQLDIALERIFLSLKEITPDPLMGALESVIDGDHDSLGANLQAAEADTEWADVESLVKELQQIEGIQSVSKGRFFLSPGLAPTFQVYMASMFENQYKLLARSGNKVQEVIVQASLSKEEMKSTILACTNRVE